MIMRGQKNQKKVVKKIKKPVLKKVKFVFDSFEANQVAVAGDFNDWDAGSLPMRKDRKKIWEKGITLKPGRYEYKFVVDGNWTSDPKNDNRTVNSMGSENSVIEVKK